MSRKFPLYTQHDAMDCGPTCLRMVASYYGQRYSSQYLREKCFISRQGVSLLGISEAAEHLGMHTIGVQLPLDRLAEDVGIGDGSCVLSVARPEVERTSPSGRRAKPSLT